MQNTIKCSYVPTKHALKTAAEWLENHGHQNALNGLAGIIGFDLNKPQKATAVRSGPVELMLSRDDSEYGIITNSHAYPCRMEGCTGMRMTVRWKDGSVTYPCSKGVDAVAPNVYRIA